VDNDSILNIRIPSGLKGRFESTCAVVGQPASAVIRSIVIAWLRDNESLSQDDVHVTVFKPDEYQAGAWQFSIGLIKQPPGTYSDIPIPFSLPDLPKRHILSDKGFRAVVLKDGGAQLGGQLVNGVWRGHVYSNGCAESENPTSLQTVRKALKRAVLETLRRFDS
jgi:hypothetical protein